MRLEKVRATLGLARELAGDPEGLTIDDISARFSVSRRTAERMRDVVDATFGPLERIDDGRRIRFRINNGLGRFAVAPTAAEMAELLNLARAMKARDPARADVLESLAAKIGAALRAPDRRRLAPDIEVHLRTEIWAHTAGPRLACCPEVLSAIRQALLSERTLQVQYRRVGEAEVRGYRLTPLGVIFGIRHYLVADFAGADHPHLLRLDRIETASVGEEVGRRPTSFDLREYAERSFGHFQEALRAVELTFSGRRATDAEAYLFHPRQRLERAADGSIRVSFEAGGLKELRAYLLDFKHETDGLSSSVIVLSVTK